MTRQDVSGGVYRWAPVIVTLAVLAFSAYGFSVKYSESIQRNISDIIKVDRKVDAETMERKVMDKTLDQRIDANSADHQRYVTREELQLVIKNQDDIKATLRDIQRRLARQ